MNQEEAGQDVANEVSKLHVDSRGKVMRNVKNDWEFLK